MVVYDSCDLTDIWVTDYETMNLNLLIYPKTVHYKKVQWICQWTGDELSVMEDGSF